MIRNKQQKANDVLMDALEMLIEVVKKNQERTETMEEMLQSSALNNTLYCKFVEERFDIDASEIANDFDEWISQFDDDELELLGKEREEIPDSKIDAEVPETLYTIEEIMSELEPPEEGLSK